jgi:adenylylsulfate kinase-like enzyme
MSINIQWQSSKLTEVGRGKIKNQKPLCLWMNGLLEAVKSHIANALEVKVNGLGKHTSSWAVHHRRRKWTSALDC